jgi:iron(III) transport system ATP-binding protein
MIIKLEDIVKRFGSVVAADGVSLEIEDGELFTLLGPSGCGKTTILRLIAGFYKPDRGNIYFNNTDVANIRPSERNIGMVFQNYALWPHMKVHKNLSYALKMRKLSHREVDIRVTQILELVGLLGLHDRYPGQLSGGQQQRVALGRALVLNPEVLLLDEPLSNLDAKFRVQVRTEIRALQKKLEITTIYVTHDQEEALTISDRIAVLDNGKVIQIGIPEELYQAPETRFVADFVGVNNLIDGKVETINEGAKLMMVATDVGKFSVGFNKQFRENDHCVLCIRPEEIVLEVHEQENSIKADVDSFFFTGPVLRYDLKIANGQIIKADVGDTRHHRRLPVGTEISISFPATRLVAIRGNRP